MIAYTYQSALLCAACAAEIMPRKRRSKNPDRYPQGPHSNGGGESDRPQHCDLCGLFLENPLTDDGIAYVKARAVSTHCPEEWAEFYRDAIDP